MLKVCDECCCVSLQGGVPVGGEERPDLLPPSVGGEGIPHTLVTPNTTGVLVTPTVPLEAVGVGVPISSDMFQGYRAVPPQTINPPALHQFSAFPQEMPEGTTVSFIPQAGMTVGDTGQADPDPMALGTAYMVGQMRSDGGQVLVEGSQPGMEHGYQEHVTIPLAGSTPMCMTTPMGLTHGGAQAVSTDMPPGETFPRIPNSYLSVRLTLMVTPTG